MPYVSKDDIMLYIDSQITLQQGVATNVNLILYKDYINNQLNAADADAITVTLYNSLGQRTFQYSDPIIAGQTDRLIVGQPASSTQGHISFDISANQAASLADGDIFVQVTITYSNYYPSAKTYVLPLLQVGYKNQPGTPSNGGGSKNGGSGSGNTGIDLGDLSGLTPYVAYNVSHIDGSNPDVKSVSFDSPDPTQVTEIIFYNLDLNNHRNVYLENFLENRIANSVDGTITIVDADNAIDYSVYKINNYSRINAEAGGGDDNDNDYTKISVTYEDNSYSPIEAPYTWAVGDTVSYTLDAFGGAGSGNSQPGQNGAQGAQGANGIDGNPGRDGVDGVDGAQGATGAQGAAGANGVDGAAGANGVDGAQGVAGSNGAQGANGIDGAQGAAGANGVDGAQGANGIGGAQGANGIDGAQGAAGANGVDGAQGAIGAQGANGVDGAQGAIGAQGANGVDGAQGAAGANGVDGAQGAAGSNGADGAQGAAGAQGANGVDGAQGAAGANGVDGAQGATGATGTGITFQGSVANSGLLPTTGNTQGDAYLNQDNDSLWIWDGNQWVDGGSIQGPAGPAGSQGAQGADGAAASAGAQGAPGANGAQGAAGANGVDGAQGAAGSNGADGAQGATGAQGAVGANGVDGAQGAAGANGADGAQGAAGANGVDGAQGAAGIAGPQGADGAIGAQGANGVDGAQGAAGANGADGAQGAAGPQGDPGIEGAQGAPGTNGAQGANGVDGAQGATGPAGPQGAQGDTGTEGAQGAPGTNGAQGAAGPTGAEGAQGAAGTNGVDGAQGAAGIGVPSGGTSGQVITKVDSNPYNTVWADPTGASGAGYTKYLLRLNYDSSESLIAGNGSHSFQAKAGYSTTGASISSVVGGSLGSVTVAFTESNPPISILVMAWDPTTNTYKVHHYDKDAANVVINTSEANFTPIGNDQYEPNFFSSFTVGVTIDTRQDYMKFGNNVQSGGFPNPVVNKNPHAYVIFVF